MIIELHLPDPFVAIFRTVRRWVLPLLALLAAQLAVAIAAIPLLRLQVRMTEFGQDSLVAWEVVAMAAVFVAGYLLAYPMVRFLREPRPLPLRGWLKVAILHGLLSAAAFAVINLLGWRMLGASPCSSLLNLQTTHCGTFRTNIDSVSFGLFTILSCALFILLAHVVFRGRVGGGLQKNV